jgi:hypothetical protein
MDRSIIEKTRSIFPLLKRNERMVFRSILIFSVLSSVCLSNRGSSNHQVPIRNASTNDSLYTSMLINHLRMNFDDIHDVSMRFHHLDDRLNGAIHLRMHWEKGRMTSSSAAVNQTGNKEFANALLETIGKWRIQDLTGPFDVTLPLVIKIVGRDDSTFFQKGIFTGEINDTAGRPVKNASIRFHSSANPDDTLRSCRSNREGIFVKTLIPAGKWNIECVADGYEKALIGDIAFNKGCHVRKKITLRPGE